MTIWQMKIKDGEWTYMRGSHERHCFITEPQYDLESKLGLFMKLEIASLLKSVLHG